MKERKLTIFTPIYNRAYCLNNCYQSMRRQKNKRFVWIIVDDGSTDNLESLVSEWIVEESEFQIEYYRKENGGMYTAYNLAFEHIITDYWMCIDSDDWLADDAVCWTEILHQISSIHWRRRSIRRLRVSIRSSSGLWTAAGIQCI